MSYGQYEGWTGEREPWNCLAVTWKLLLVAARSLEALLVVVLPTWHPPSLETLPVRSHLGPT